MSQPAVRGCKVGAVIDGVRYDTGATARGRYVLTDRTYQCRSTLETPAPDRAIVLHNTPWGACFSGTTFVQAANWTLVLTPAGQVIYTCTR